MVGRELVVSDRKKKRKIETDGLFIPGRQVSKLVVGGIAAACIVFMGGYFIGKKHTMEQLVANMEQDSFADQVYSSLCNLYEYDAQAMVVAHQEATDQEMPVGESPLEEAQEQEAEETMEEQADGPAYAAQLLSYHVRRHADDFVQKLAYKNIPLKVRARKSVTAGGEAKEWYQVVTKPYVDRDELQLVVDQVVREERIKGAQIITC